MKSHDDNFTMPVHRLMYVSIELCQLKKNVTKRKLLMSSFQKAKDFENPTISLGFIKFSLAVIHPSTLHT